MSHQPARTITDDVIEERLTAFEKEWRSGCVPAISRFLATDSALDESSTARLMGELIAVDLEFRWSVTNAELREDDAIGFQPRLSAYVDAVETLDSVAELPSWAVAEEFRVRRLWGDQPTIDQFLAEYPQRIRDLLSVVTRIHHEIAADGEHSDVRLNVTEPVACDPRVSIPFSDFLLERHVKTGGMGKVYRAVQRSNQRIVAVKSLLKSRQTSPAAVEQFIHEAQIVRQLEHPNIVRVYGLGRFPGGGHFLVMDFIEGRDLAARLEFGPASFAEAIEITCTVARAIDYAHQRGIVHCDLKPSNVLLHHSGKPYVTDFGMARLIDTGVEGSELLGGTPAYMAPEQTQLGVACANVAVDIYGIGAILYSLLTGRPPHDGESPSAILDQIRSGGEPDLASTWRPDVPDDLDQICSTCLKRIPAERYATAQAIAVALEQYK